MVKQCCVCSKVKTDGKWQLENGPRAGAAITHAYCPACFAGIMARIRRHAQDRTRKMKSREPARALYGA